MAVTQDDDMVEATIDSEVEINDESMEMKSDVATRDANGEMNTLGVETTNEIIEAPTQPIIETANATCDLKTQKALETSLSTEAASNEKTDTEIPLTNKESSGRDMSLSSPLDSALSPLHRYIRRHCVEYFVSESQSRVGIRCVFCKNVENKVEKSRILPAAVDEICATVLTLQSQHLPHCREIPSSMREELNNLEESSDEKDEDTSPDKKNIWVQSALEKELIDTKDGIKFQNVREKKREVVFTDVETPRRGSRNSFIENRSTRFTEKNIITDKQCNKAQASPEKEDCEKLKQEEEGTWECTNCSATHSTDKIRCGKCNRYREGYSRRNKRAHASSERGEVSKNDDDAEEEDVNTWECTNCSAIHSADKVRCGKCKSYRKRHSQSQEKVSSRERPKRARASPQRYGEQIKVENDEDEGNERNEAARPKRVQTSPVKYNDDDIDEDDEEEEEETWGCVNCSAIHSGDKVRCGKCKHYREGGHSPNRRSSSRSAPSKRKSTRTLSHELKVVPKTRKQTIPKGGWVCCEKVYTSDRRRCNVCKKWNSQYKKSNSEWSADMKLPSGIELKNTPEKNLCNVLGCHKRRQVNNDGFCRRHYNFIVLGKDSAFQSPRGRSSVGRTNGSGVKDEKLEEVIVLDDDRSTSSMTKPQDRKSHGFDNNAQNSGSSAFNRHRRQGNVKYDNVERAKRHSPSKIRNSSSRHHKQTASTPPMIDTNDTNLRRSGRAFTPSPKIRHLDYTSDDSVEIVSPSRRGKKRSRSGDEKEKIPTPKKKDSVDDNLRCRFDGCTKYKQSGKDGYCWAHFQRNGISTNNEDNNTGDFKKTDRQRGGDVLSSPSKKKTKVTEVLPILKTETSKNKLNGSDLRVLSSFEHRQANNNTSYDTIKVGDMVKVDGSALARVLKVDSSVGGDTLTYHIMKILGGRDQIVGKTRLSVHQRGNLVQSQPVFGALQRDIKPFRNTYAMMEMTRYKLLSGEDCWICTSCSVIVPSLTMPCGICNMHPSFVPLEMKEFENFVRVQRKKQNYLWLRKQNNVFGDMNPSAHLCKFQGCVQPSQISYDGYCECHVNAADLVREKDRDLTSDYMFYLYEQLEPIILTENDMLNYRHKDKSVGDAGLACKHCHGCRKFPKDSEAMRQKSFTTGLTAHIESCKKCPQEKKARLMLLREQNEVDKNDGKPKTGSTRKFLQRISKRLQRLSFQELKMCRLQGCKEFAKPNYDGLCHGHRAAARIVLPEDHSIIQDFDSLVFEQLQPCYLIETDRENGSHQNMANGAPGLECRHCIGQPNHVRYFPENATSLKDICSVTLVSAHLMSCKSCPEKIKAKLVSLGQINESEDRMKTFYDRVWCRLQPTQK